ncbi:carbohydrate kinase family protein [Candidatus Poribacteria bacterium]
MEPLQIDPSRRRYHTLIGTGGIGSGVFFALNGNHTLGREESRSGRFLDRRDYCKLHIVTHYVQTLMGPNFTTTPIGAVGDDDQGQILLNEMAEAGLNMRHVHSLPRKPTLYCVCFVYPDGSGGNLTVDDSACSEVDPALIREAEPDFADYSGAGIALAVPEVPIAARTELLELGTKYGFLRAASFTSEEIASARDLGMLTGLDLLVINVDEAAALAGVSSEQPAVSVVEAAVQSLQQINAAVHVSITAGSHGSWVWDGEKLTHVPVYGVEAVSTAGAGDAHFAGILTGLAAGLSLVEAHELGVLVAALSVTSPHTISKDVDRYSLRTLADAMQAPLCIRVRELLRL